MASDSFQAWGASLCWGDEALPALEAGATLDLMLDLGDEDDHVLTSGGAGNLHPTASMIAPTVSAVRIGMASVELSEQGCAADQESCVIVPPARSSVPVVSASAVAGMCRTSAASAAAMSSSTPGTAAEETATAAVQVAETTREVGVRGLHSGDTLTVHTTAHVSSAADAVITGAPCFTDTNMPMLAEQVTPVRRRIRELETNDLIDYPLSPDYAPEPGHCAQHVEPCEAPLEASFQPFISAPLRRVCELETNDLIDYPLSPHYGASQVALSLRKDSNTISRGAEELSFPSSSPAVAVPMIQAPVGVQEGKLAASSVSMGRAEESNVTHHEAFKSDPSQIGGVEGSAHGSSQAAVLEDGQLRTSQDGSNGFTKCREELAASSLPVGGVHENSSCTQRESHESVSTQKARLDSSDATVPVAPCLRDAEWCNFLSSVWDSPRDRFEPATLPYQPFQPSMPHSEVRHGALHVHISTRPVRVPSGVSIFEKLLDCHDLTQPYEPIVTDEAEVRSRIVLEPDRASQCTLPVPEPHQPSESQEALCAPIAEIVPGMTEGCREEKHVPPDTRPRLEIPGPSAIPHVATPCRPGSATQQMRTYDLPAPVTHQQGAPERSKCVTSATISRQGNEYCCEQTQPYQPRSTWAVPPRPVVESSSSSQCTLQVPSHIYTPPSLLVPGPPALLRVATASGPDVRVLHDSATPRKRPHGLSIKSDASERKVPPRVRLIETIDSSDSLPTESCSGTQPEAAWIVPIKRRRAEEAARKDSVKALRKLKEESPVIDPDRPRQQRQLKLESFWGS